MESSTDRYRESGILPVLTFNPDNLSFQKEKNKTNNEIECLKCEKTWEFPIGKDEYLAHLFLEHRLIIADVDEISLLEDYLKFWHDELQGKELEEYCTTMLLDQLPDGRPAKQEKYFLLSDILPRDFELRRSLQRERLEKALVQHQFERTDRNFTKECLYCRDVITGLRADYLEHLFKKHFLQLGKPENLVYVDELLDTVQHNIEHLVCLYCEKIFKDRVTLKEHMRKKGHKRINPNNREYDRFFLLNYRYNKARTKTQKTSRTRGQGNADNGSGTSNQQQQLDENFDFKRRFGSSDDSDSDWADWDDEKLPPLNCLYCKHKEANFGMLKEHMLKQHQLDFDDAVKGLNFYQKIKVVNFVRRQMCLQRCVTCNIRCDTADSLLEHMSVEEHAGVGTQKQWDKPEFFFPTYEDDGLLCILDDNANDDTNDSIVRIISEDTMVKINKEAERLSLENFKLP